MTAPFVIRPASSALNDGDRILHFLDSQLPWLAQHGAEEQWGSVPFSDNEESISKYRAKVARSETTNQSWNQEWVKVYIAEFGGMATDSDSSHGDGNTPRLPIAAMVLSGSSPAYTHSVIPIQDEEDPFLYVSLVVSDRSMGTVCKGSGGALLDHAKSLARSLRLNRICLDCWNGNERRLVKYYEHKGFQAIGDFVELDHRWCGTVLEANIRPLS